MSLSYFSNFGSLKSTETEQPAQHCECGFHFSNFGSLKSTETSLFSGALSPLILISAISAR